MLAGGGTLSEPRANDLVTQKIRLVRPLGAGGMGSVWLADHLALHTQVVVKFIAEALATNKEVLGRFEREAAAASQVKSPHVVQILDHGVSDAGRPFMVMELLEGHDLSTHIEKLGRLPLTDVAEIVAQLSRALSRAHERGIVHRDIKPQNIFLCDAGSGELFVKLLDFGIAKGAAVEKLDAATKTGTVVGTPYYMSPEQLVGAKDVDFHTDLWSVGVVAFEAMTGTRAFDAETIGALALRIHNEPLPLPSQRLDAANPAVDEWFQRACARAPADRFSSAKDMADALTAAVTGDAARKPLSASGSAPTPSVQDPTLALAKTQIDTRPDSNALSYAGVERVTVTKGPPRRALIVLGGVGLGAAVVVLALSLRHGDRDVRVSPATSVVVPAAPPSPLPSASIVEEPPAPVPVASSAAVPAVPAPVHAKHPHLTHAGHTASAAPAHSAKPPSEDDIK
jgi:serine/threonine protein kinase